MKNALDWTNRWLDILEEKINELEDIAKETIQNEIQKENQFFFLNEPTISELWQIQVAYYLCNCSSQWRSLQSVST